MVWPLNAKTTASAGRIWGRWDACARLWAVAFCLCLFSGRAAEANRVVFTSACDGSAAAAVSDALFASASDEENAIRLYRFNAGGAPVSALSLKSFLSVRGEKGEADLEAAARIGSRIYWIGSHGVDRDGKVEWARRRFFATDIVSDAAGVRLVPVGRFYRNLVRDLDRLPAWTERRSQGKAPSAPLEIEGLGEGEGGKLWLGLRGPVLAGQAILVGLANPAAVVESGAPAQLGPIVGLDLGGLGIRDLVRHEDKLYVLAGEEEGRDDRRIFVWSERDGQLRLVHRFQTKHFYPESMLVATRSGQPQILVMSDDGSRRIDGVECKDLKDPLARRFQGLWLPMP